MNDESTSVRVAVRLRPFLPSEKGEGRCVEVLSSTGTTLTDMIQIGGPTGKSFMFDVAYETDSTQRGVFMKSVLPLVEACLDGYNATILAYGQTGSGKTFTIFGPSNTASFEGDMESLDPTNICEMPLSNSFKSRINSGQSGIISRALRELFRRLELTRKDACSGEKEGKCEEVKDEENDEEPTQVVKEATTEELSTGDGSDSGKSTSSPPPPYEYDVRVQFLEVYGEQIRDLLSSSSTKLDIRDGGQSLEPEVIGALELKVTSAEEALLCFTRGALRRVTGATAMNAESSRSHAIMTVIVEQSTVIRHVGVESEDTESGHPEIEIKRSKFHFVDLAGCERQKRSKAEGHRLKEGIEINKGLLVLGNVISALGDPTKKGKAFVPYRDSKLTRLLKGSLGGNHKTVMIACVSPSSSNMEETLNCLRYANRAKNIQNNAVVNVDSSSRVLTELRAQVQALANELLSLRCNNKENDPPLFSTAILKEIAKGKDSSGLQIASNSVAKSNTLIGGSNSFGTGGVSLSKMAKSDREEQLKKQLDKANAQIVILREKMKQSVDNVRTKSEEVFAANAEKEYYRLQIPGNENEFPNSLEATQKSKEGHSNPAFHKKAMEYEREIAQLKEELREMRAITEPFCNSDDSTTRTFISTQSTITGDLSETSAVNAKTHHRRSLSEVFESEATAEQAEIEKDVQKYLKLDEESELDREDDEEKQSVAKTASNVVEDKEEDFIHRQAQIDAHMLQLSKGIAAKEELISQLRLSQTKYESMRIFYQEKLGQMQMQLAERETERNRLIDELRKHEAHSNKFKVIQVALDSKEKQIYQLRTRESDIAKLTTVSSRNETIMNRLATDITEMKKQKNNLQKQLSKERKEHSSAMQALRKDLLAQERDAAKSKQELNKMQWERDRIQKVAKQNAEQLSKIRAKYRKSEKKTRMQTVKRGVMEKIGIDDVMVGRRQGQTTILGNRSTTFKYDSSGNVDQIRSFLDEKVAEIGRKEAAADRLAKEWEDHFELTVRKEELLNESRNDNESSNEEMEALDIQIQFKEEAIRQLAQHLGDRPKDSKHGNVSRYPFIENRKFIDLCGEMSALSSAQLAAKVLFGMVVREKKRVAALARTASSLDQKVIDAEKIAASNESALRSHMEESRHERATMAQNQQEKILSLMAIVQNDSGDASDINSVATVKMSSRAPDNVVLQLANERIDLLESQLTDFQGEREAMEALKVKEAGSAQKVVKVNEKCKELKKDLKHVRNLFKKLRNKISSLQIPKRSNEIGDDDESRLFDELMDIFQDVIETRDENTENDGKDISSIIDSDEEAILPAWAGDIMQDIAIIAVGDIPPSLKATPSKRPPVVPNVFERLTDPDNFTGTQKNCFLAKDDQSSQASNADSKYSRRRLFRQATPTRSNYDYDQNSVLSAADSKYSRTSVSGRKGDQSSIFSGSESRYSRNSTPTRKGRSIKHSSSTPNRARAKSSRSTTKPGGPPRVVSLQGRQSSDYSFVDEYTQTDVFERLQKKATNSYELRRDEEKIDRLQEKC